AHLPHARQAGANREAAALPRFVLLDLARDGRARAYDGHLAAEDVDELRELVDAVLANEAADGGDPRIALHLEDRAVHLVLRDELGLELLGVDHHRPELEHEEATAMEPHALLLEEHRPARRELDDERHGDE